MEGVVDFKMIKKLTIPMNSLISNFGESTLEIWTPTFWILIQRWKRANFNLSMRKILIFELRPLEPMIKRKTPYYL